MSVFWLRRRANTTHICAWDCFVPIRSGQFYQEVTISPGDDEFGIGKWRRLRYHGGDHHDCPIDWRFRGWPPLKNLLPTKVI